MAQPFGSDIPRLSWLGGKTYPTHFNSRKNKSANSPEHAAALAENANFDLLRQEATGDAPIVEE